MAYGYSQQTIEANKSADKRLVGVMLGRVCIAGKVPVSTVAEKFGVSRQTIYNWFEGKHLPRPELLRPIDAFITASLKK